MTIKKALRGATVFKGSPVFEWSEHSSENSIKILPGYPVTCYACGLEGESELLEYYQTDRLGSLKTTQVLRHIERCPRCKSRRLSHVVVGAEQP